MGHADRLAAPIEVPGSLGASEPEIFVQIGPATHRGRKPGSLRGRCALLLLLAMSIAGYGAMFYIGQIFLVN